MNKFNLFIITLGLMLMSQLHAAESSRPASSFIDNASHGFANIASGVVEIPKNVINIGAESNVFLGASLGLVRGVVHTVSRTMVGVFELLASPFIDESLAKPGYVWERFSEDSRYFDLHYPLPWTHFGPMDEGEKLRRE